MPRFRVDSFSHLFTLPSYFLRIFRSLESHHTRSLIILLTILQLNLQLHLFGWSRHIYCEFCDSSALLFLYTYIYIGHPQYTYIIVYSYYPMYRSSHVGLTFPVRGVSIIIFRCQFLAAGLTRDSNLASALGSPGSDSWQRENPVSHSAGKSELHFSL